MMATNNMPTITRMAKRVVQNVRKSAAIYLSTLYSRAETLEQFPETFFVSKSRQFTKKGFVFIKNLTCHTSTRGIPLSQICQNHILVQSDICKESEYTLRLRQNVVSD